MLETQDLILAKGKPEDWRDMYRNVWSRPEAARYMKWSLSESEADAPARMERTVAFQKEHSGMYIVYEKATGQAIGFAGVRKLSDTLCEETGICLGPDFVGRGYGKQILQCLLQYAKEVYGVQEFQYSTREENAPSVALVRSFGFRFAEAEDMEDERNGQRYRLLRFRLTL